MSTALAFLRRDFSLALSYRLSFLLQIGGIFFSIAIFFFLSELFGSAIAPQLVEYGGNYFSFVLIGLAFTGFLGLSLSSFAESIREGQLSPAEDKQTRPHNLPAPTTPLIGRKTELIDIKSRLRDPACGLLVGVVG